MDHGEGTTGDPPPEESDEKHRSAAEPRSARGLTRTRPTCRPGFQWLWQPADRAVLAKSGAAASQLDVLSNRPEPAQCSIEPVVRCRNRAFRTPAREPPPRGLPGSAGRTWPAW